MGEHGPSIGFNYCHTQRHPERVGPLGDLLTRAANAGAICVVSDRDVADAGAGPLPERSLSGSTVIKGQGGFMRPASTQSVVERGA